MNRSDGAMFPGRFRSGDMRKGFIFTDRKISNRAIMAVVLGLISLISLGVLILQAYEAAGDVSVKYGVAGLLSGIYALIGLVLGIVTMCEKNYYKLFPVLGILLNLTSLAGVGLILYMGVK